MISNGKGYSMTSKSAQYWYNYMISNGKGYSMISKPAYWYISNGTGDLTGSGVHTWPQSSF